ncbi:hypothetical protein LINPERHAP1_LOCUS38247 [Linum perenne]
MRAGELHIKKRDGELPMQDIGGSGGQHEGHDRVGGMHQSMWSR